MRLAYIKKMDERVDPRHVCLYHGTTWKSSFHHIINKLRRDIGGEHIGQISRVICTCEICLETDGENVAQGRQHSRAEINTMWEGVSQDDFATAQEYFEAYIEQQDPCEEFRGFLQSFYRRLQRANLLTDQDTSARRFLYILHRALEHRDFRFQPQSRRERQNTFHTETVHLASLKPQDIGVCIGRRGNRIRHVVLPRCKISISVDQATNNVNATIKCPPKSVEDQKKKLLHHADVVGEARRQHERDVEEYNKDLARVQNDSNNDADDDDDDDDDDEFDDCN